MITKLLEAWRRRARKKKIRRGPMFPRFRPRLEQLEGRLLLAALNTFTGLAVNNTDWFDQGNWTLNHPPVGGEWADIPQGKTCILDTKVQLPVGGPPGGNNIQQGVDQLTIEGSFQLATRLNVGTGAQIAAGGLLYLNGGQLNVGLFPPPNPFGQVSNSGALTGNGTIVGTLLNDGTVKPFVWLPGAAAPDAGVITVEGTYTQGATGTLEIVLFPPAGAASTSSKLEVSGFMNLGGTFSAIMAQPGFAFEGTEEYMPVANSGFSNGDFATYSCPAVLRPLKLTHEWVGGPFGINESLVVKIEKVAVQKVKPNKGPVAGGNQVGVIGIGFTGATLVSFGTYTTTDFTVYTDNVIVVNHVPAATAAGTVDVTVTAGVESLPNPPGDQYTYLTPRQVGAVEGQSFTAIVGTTYGAVSPVAVALIDWGDGETSLGTYNATNGTVSGTHTYLEESAPNSPYLIHTTLVDPLNGEQDLYAEATVADAPLTVTANNFSAQENQPWGGVVATFSDSDPNGTLSDYTATIDYGDGSTGSGVIAVGPNNTFTVSGSHTWATHGGYTVTVTVNDVGGATASAQCLASIYPAPGPHFAPPPLPLSPGNLPLALPELPPLDPGAQLQTLQAVVDQGFLLAGSQAASSFGADSVPVATLQQGEQAVDALFAKGEEGWDVVAGILAPL